MDTWEKYANKFPLKRYTLKRLETYNAEGALCYEYLLMDRVRCKKVIQRHPDLFKNEDADLIVGRIEAQGLHSLNNHEAIGVLLGYDHKSSAAFERRERLLDQLVNTTTIPAQLPKIDGMTSVHIREARKNGGSHSSASFYQAARQYAKQGELLSASSTSLGKRALLHPLSLPCYQVDPTNQTCHKMIQQYEKERATLAKLYTNNSFLDIVLKKLCTCS